MEEQRRGGGEGLTWNGTSQGGGWGTEGQTWAPSPSEKLCVSRVALGSSHRPACPIGCCQAPPPPGSLRASSQADLLRTLSSHGPPWSVDALGCYLLECGAGPWLVPQSLGVSAGS